MIEILYNYYPKKFLIQQISENIYNSNAYVRYWNMVLAFNIASPRLKDIFILGLKDKHDGVRLFSLYGLLDIEELQIIKSHLITEVENDIKQEIEEILED